MSLQRILIIENSFRPGMGSFIAKGFDEAKDVDVETLVIPSEESLAGLKNFDPDVVLVNMDSLRRSDALTSALAIRGESPSRVIIFMSERENPAIAKEGLVSALYTHAYWLNKPCRDPRTVIAEIERAYEGGVSVDATLLEAVLTEHNYQGLLSPQQHRVMRLMSTGLSNAAIGRQCGITTKAVERTIASASKLLNVEAASAETNHRVNAAMKYLKAMSFI
jgi:DNA-binding NarL/FixJ family response regulator